MPLVLPCLRAPGSQASVLGHGRHPHPVIRWIVHRFEARLCLACDPAPCAAACPTGAYTQRKAGAFSYA